MQRHSAFIDFYSCIIVFHAKVFVSSSLLSVSTQLIIHKNMVKTRGILSQKNWISENLTNFVAYFSALRIKAKNCDPFGEIQRRI